jgi:hypothetical protein
MAKTMLKSTVKNRWIHGPLMRGYSAIARLCTNGLASGRRQPVVRSPD